MEEALPAAVVNRAKELKSVLENEYDGMDVEQKQQTLLSVYDEIAENLDILPENIQLMHESISKKIPGVETGNQKDMDSVYGKLLLMVDQVSEMAAIPEVPPLPPAPMGGSKIGKKFDKCVKAVRKTVKARKGSTKESAAIAICTTTILHPRKRTIKRYRKGRLVTQKRKMRGGDQSAAQRVIDSLRTQIEGVEMTSQTTVKIPPEDAKGALEYLEPKLVAMKAANPGIKATLKNAVSGFFSKKTGGGDTEFTIETLKGFAAGKSYTGYASSVDDMITKMESAMAFA